MAKINRKIWFFSVLLFCISVSFGIISLIENEQKNVKHNSVTQQYSDTIMNELSKIDGGLKEISNVQQLNSFIGNWINSENGINCANSQTNYSFAIIGEAEVGQILYIKARIVLNSGTRYGIAFGIKEASAPAAAYEAAIFDKSANDFRLYSYNTGDIGFNSSVVLSCEESETVNGSENCLEIVVYNNDIEYMVNGKYVGRINDCLYEGGYFGIFSRKSDITVTSLEYYHATPEQALTDMQIDGVKLYGQFSADKYYYRGMSDADENELSVELSVKSGYELLNETANSNTVTFKLEDGENKFFVYLKNTLTENITAIFLSVNRRIAVEKTYGDKYRCDFHFSTGEGWTQDPGALWYNAVTGEYHLYSDYSYEAVTLDCTSWRHAVSTDLVHWKEYDVILEKSYNDMRMFSGCCVVDYNNTSGLFNESIAPAERVVIINTYRDNVTNFDIGQYLAYSLDGGYSFIKYGKPVLTETKYYQGNFRDPRIYWYSDESIPGGGKWIMVIAGGEAQIFSSYNLLEWEYESTLRGTDGEIIVSECPDFYELPLDGDAEKTKWVYIASGKYYIVGDLKYENDTFTFVAEQESLPFNGNGGDPLYATASTLYDKYNRHISLSWIMDSSVKKNDDGLLKYADKKWNGMMSLFYEESLKTIDGKMVLFSKPVDEYSLLEGKVAYSAENITVQDSDPNIFENITAGNCKIELIVDATNAQRLEIELIKDGEKQSAYIAYSAITDKLYLKTEINKMHTMTITKMTDDTAKIEIYIDTSLVDVIGNDGEAAFVGKTFVGKNADTKLIFSVVRGSVDIKSLTITEMRSSWND